MEHIDMILFQTEYERMGALEDFLDGYYSADLNYLASDLLQQGLSPREVVQAIRKAFVICRNGGEDPRRHFYPIYTQYQGSTVQDCKLSEFGYNLTLLNAPEHLPVVASFQLELLRASGKL
jgi:hypothetical protein